MKAQLERLNYEIRKIGVNINQAVKKLNQGIGTQNDIDRLLMYMTDIAHLLEEIKCKLDATKEGGLSCGDNETDAYE